MWSAHSDQWSEGCARTARRHCGESSYGPAGHFLGTSTGHFVGIGVSLVHEVTAAAEEAPNVDEPPDPASSTGDNGLTAAVHALLRAGLPPGDDSAPDTLLDQSAVTARAVDPADRASRLRALD